MIKRCLLYVLSFGLLVTGLSVGYSDDANAWQSNPIAECTYNDGVINSDWQADLAAEMPEFNLSAGNYVIGRTSGDTNPNHATVWWQNNGADIYMIQVWYASGPIEYNFLTQSDNYGVTAYLDENGLSNFSPSNGSHSLNMTDASCISYAKGIRYTTAEDYSTGVLAWTGIPSSAAWQTDQPDIPEAGGSGGVAIEPACEAWDFSCYIGRLTDTVGDFFSGVGNTFADLATALVTGIGALFIPDSAVVQNAWQGLVDSFTTQLGFLLAPFDFILSVGNHVVNDPQTTCTIFGGGVTFLGSNSSMDICQLDEQMPLLFGFLRTLAQAGIFLWLASEFTKKYHEVVKA